MTEGGIREQMVLQVSSSNPQGAFHERVGVRPLMVDACLLEFSPALHLSALCGPCLPWVLLSCLVAWTLLGALLADGV